jgi:hypothetical protein
MRALLAAALLLAALPAAAEEAGHADSALGARAIFYRPRDADHGVWAPGLHARWRAEPQWAGELSVDHARHSSAGARYRTIPLQVSAIGYLKPEDKVSPYVLLGYGWYFVKLGGPGARSDVFTHPHAGVGMQALLGSLTLDAAYRLLWTAAWRPVDTRPWGRNYKDKGSMWTLGLSYRFKS